MPKKPKQIHLIRNAPQDFFNLYRDAVYARAHVKALCHRYDSIIDLENDEDDPLVDLPEAFELYDKIVVAQKAYSEAYRKVSQFSAKTGFNADPSRSGELDPNTSPKRKFAYVDDSEVAVGTIPTKKVHFAEYPVVCSTTRPVSRLSTIKRMCKRTSKLLHGIAYTISEHSPKESLESSDDGILSNMCAPSKDEKRRSETDHYDDLSASPTKKSKISHQNIWPEAYSYKDVGIDLGSTNSINSLANNGQDPRQPVSASCSNGTLSRDGISRRCKTEKTDKIVLHEVTYPPISKKVAKNSSTWIATLKELYVPCLVAATITTAIGAVL